MTSVGTGCETAGEHAESATLHAFLNCYLRETGDGEILAGDAGAVPDAVPSGTARADGRVVRVPFPAHDLDVFAPLRYESATGRHLFDLPAYTVTRGAEETETETGEARPLDVATLAALARRELALSADGDVTEGTDLLRRVLASRHATERFVEAWLTDLDEEHLYGAETTFRDAEQSLVYGHHLHPTPKSREGIPAHDAPRFAPELRGGFQLRYFAAAPEIVSEWSAREQSAEAWIRSTVSEEELPSGEKGKLPSDEEVIIPVHPWQAEYLCSQPHVAAALERGDLRDLGTFGPEFYPTTSVRTLWTRDAPFMVKGSLAVKITNAERTNKRPELERGVAVSELLDTAFGDRLAEQFPRFSVLEDPAAITLDIGEGAESGFETVLRENPFRGEDAVNVSPVAGLCQDGIDGPSRLARIVSDIAERDGADESAASNAADESAVACEWFREYLAVTVRPVLWAYFELGVGVEAHQQNTLVRLDEDGWPAEGYYRDNQGYYFPESRYEQVDDWLPGVGERADTLCPDAVADERLRYYVVLNNAFGVVNALGVAGLADETELLAVLREELDALAEYEPPESDLVSTLLSEPEIPCKGNLLTRFEGLDELEGSLENQSVYTDIENPLVTRL
jgi:siderophore synthetase component